MEIRDLFVKNMEYIKAGKIDAEKINAQFISEGLNDFTEIGKVDIPSGRICVGDPLVFVGTDQRAVPQMAVSIAPGSYPVEISVAFSAVTGPKICSSRLKVTGEKAIRYEKALSTKETYVYKLNDNEEPLAFFPVEAGLMCFIDAEEEKEYSRFLGGWHRDNPGKNHYDDYFAKFFAESFEKDSKLQRKDGDYIEWTNPRTNNKITMNSTGFGDGLYQCFWGYDKDNNICELLVPFIDAEIIKDAHKEYLDIWDGPDMCIVTNHVAEGGPIAYASRIEPNNPMDSGWMFYGVDEDEAYWDDSNNFTIYSIHRLCERNPELKSILHSEIGSGFFGNTDDTFTRDENA